MVHGRAEAEDDRERAGGATAGACAVLTVDGGHGGAVLSVVAPGGRTPHRAGVVTGAADLAPTGGDLVAAVLAAAVEDLTPAGWGPSGGLGPRLAPRNATRPAPERVQHALGVPGGG